MKATDLRREFVDLLARAWPVGAPDEGEPNPYGETAAFNDDEQQELPEAAMPTALLVVVEWQGSDGHRWLSRYGALGNGDPAPNWTLEMLGHEAETWDDPPAS